MGELDGGGDHVGTCGQPAVALSRGPPRLDRRARRLGVRVQLSPAPKDVRPQAVATAAVAALTSENAKLRRQNRHLRMLLEKAAREVDSLVKLYERRESGSGRSPVRPGHEEVAWG